MKAISILLLLGLSVAYCRKIDYCSVARAARAAGAGRHTADIVCLAAYASNYDSSLNRSPSEYGIFQINSYWWCDDYKTPRRKNLCKIPCRRLLNTYLIDDIKCVLRIIKDPNGFGAWTPWKRGCKGKNLNRFIAGC